MFGPSPGLPANADAATSRAKNSKPVLIAAAFRRAAHLYLALYIGNWIIEGLGCESAVSGSPWRPEQIEFPSLRPCVRAPAPGARGKARPPARRMRLPARDRRSAQAPSSPSAALA